MDRKLFLYLRADMAGGSAARILAEMRQYAKRTYSCLFAETLTAQMQAEIDAIDGLIRTASELRLGTQDTRVEGMS